MNNDDLNPKPPRDLYLEGNRLFEEGRPLEALSAWKRAGRLWQGVGFRVRFRAWAAARAAVMLLATVMVFYGLLFLAFPRKPEEMSMMNAQGHRMNWWEDWLNTGRPSQEPGPRVDFRDWWYSFKQRKLLEEMRRLAQEREQQGGAKDFRPTVNQRWDELLRRYGRWGQSDQLSMDPRVVSGFGLGAMGSYDEAIQVLEKAAQNTHDRADLADIYQGLANTWYYKGYILQDNGLARYDLPMVKKAAEYFEKSIVQYPHPVSYGNAGWMYFLLGDYGRAESSSFKGLAMDGSLEYIRLNLGIIHLAQARYSESFEDYHSVVSRAPDEEVYLGGLNDLKELVRDNPGKYPFAHLMIAYLSIHKGDIPESRRQLARFLMNPSPGSQWKELARRWLEDPSSAMDKS
ncbi:MAG: tetratricopeptide repeat protein [Deltaproteobacteria bacterium]|nr:tetratricopeptide repeat protein [Deltaproteobacteria bacterium]